AWLLRPALVRFGCRGEDIVAHLLSKHLCLPAKYVLVELRHALAVVVGHFEVNDRVHFAHGDPPCRLFETFEATLPRANGAFQSASSRCVTGSPCRISQENRTRARTADIPGHCRAYA